MIDSIHVQGKLLHECTMEGERRIDDVYPGHGNGCQLSADRWMLIYATRGWRETDDDRSIIYQLRADRPDGRIVREGRLRKSIDDWDADDDGKTSILQFGHPGVFGIPKGAMVKGKPAPNANVFMARWRRNRYGTIDPKTGLVERLRATESRLLHVEEIQFRLNEEEDDIEVLGPVKMSRELGHEEGLEFCRRGSLLWMNQSISQSVSYNDEGTEWVAVNHFSGGCVAAVKYRFNPDAGLYEWVDTGPLLQTAGRTHTEASIVRGRDRWIICTRADRIEEIKGANGWTTSEDPFKNLSEPVFTRNRKNRTPFTLYNRPDGEIQMFTGDPEASPYRNARNPLFTWRIDPETFEESDRREIFDNIREGLFKPEMTPKSEMCKLLPHAGGREQYLLWRCRVMNLEVSGPKGPAITEEMKEPHGIYYARVRYTEDLPARWDLG